MLKASSLRDTGAPVGEGRQVWVLLLFFSLLINHAASAQNVKNEIHLNCVMSAGNDLRLRIDLQRKRLFRYPVPNPISIEVNEDRIFHRTLLDDGRLAALISIDRFTLKITYYSPANGLFLGRDWIEGQCQTVQRRF